MKFGGVSIAPHARSRSDGHYRHRKGLNPYTPVMRHETAASICGSAGGDIEIAEMPTANIPSLAMFSRSVPITDARYRTVVRKPSKAATAFTRRKIIDGMQPKNAPSEAEEMAPGESGTFVSGRKRSIRRLRTPASTLPINSDKRDPERVMPVSLTAPTGNAVHGTYPSNSGETTHGFSGKISAQRHYPCLKPAPCALVPG